MSKIQFLRIIYWVLFASTIILFYYSLRYSPEYRVYTTSGALILWGVAFLINRYIKKNEDLLFEAVYTKCILILHTINLRTDRKRHIFVWLEY